MPPEGVGGGGQLARHARAGLQAPICLTWELTYACNLSCVHCLSASGRPDPAELTTSQCRQVLDALAAMRVFYINVGGGEPTLRPDFWELLDYAVDRRIGVKFSTNGVRLDRVAAQRLVATDYVDVQISVDGADSDVNDAVRGVGSFAIAERAMTNLAEAGFVNFKISVAVTRRNVEQLDAFAALADRYHAQLRLTRLRPSGRGVDVWNELHPTADQQRRLHAWLLEHGESVLTGDSFFHLSALGDPLPGLNLCGAGRVVCLIDPIGDVYACPFAIAEEFKAGNVRDPGGFPGVWRTAPLFAQLRNATAGGACLSCSAYDACQGGCMAAKYFTGLPLDGPDPECVRGFGDQALAAAPPRTLPRPSADHSRRPGPVPLSLRPTRPVRACDSSPLAEAR